MFLITLVKEIFESLSYSDISILPCPISADEHGDLANGIIGKVLQTIYRVSSICIHDLCIKQVEEKIHYSAEYWESHNLEFVRSLKEVEMEIKGKDSEMELIKYFLKNAKALKKMTILYPSALRRQSMISRKIQQFQMASSSIVLYFLQKCLEVDMAHGSSLKLPAASFGGLKSLTLRHLSVSIALFGEWISSCKSLKMLYIDGVCGIHELNIFCQSKK
ncbi:hypothetical protein FEM48_Zijuj05G0026100 [Ziziphus jujuba var. spinosa]|uniref:FBD domain-containing protein n=1 Tax=Ziziphus jujuba var. spinosa TaxID=714518 RepID=A0A978VCB7_ZIZJJ|nr:hypothetical protein FEM48_Zijuj05G0026100 [Ziziphus jujuba var. spinosa]